MTADRKLRHRNSLQFTTRCEVRSAWTGHPRNTNVLYVTTVRQRPVSLQTPRKAGVSTSNWEVSLCNSELCNGTSDQDDLVLSNSYVLPGTGFDGFF